MQVAPSGRAGVPSILGNAAIPGAFSGGNVYIDPIQNATNISVANVNFAPGARTHYHTHEGYQLLTVIAGSGWICEQGGKPVRISVGDVIYCPPGTTHWHGADDGSYMVHTAVSVGGVKWLQAVEDSEYANKSKGGS